MAERNAQIRQVLGREKAKAVVSIDRYQTLDIECRGGNQVRVGHYLVEFEKAYVNKHQNPTDVDDQVLVLEDPRFKEAGIGQIAVIDEERGLSELVKHEFADNACQSAGCNFGENCLKKRK